MASESSSTTAAAAAAAAATGNGATGASDERPVVYVGFAADLVHHGHINIIRHARALGRVTVGLLTDEAIKSYKRETICNWDERRVVVANLVGVENVIPQETLDYSPNLRKLRPKYLVHGSDWRTGVQSKTRQKAIDTLAAWGGELVEPEYTKNISTTQIIQRCHEDYETVLVNQASPVLEPVKSGSEDVPELGSLDDSILSGSERAAVDGIERPIAYVAISTDFVHHGHIRVIDEARKLGSVIIGLLTDEAVTSKKDKPIVAFPHRWEVFQNIAGVRAVVTQRSFDQIPNLRAIKPEFVVHGADWKKGARSAERESVVQTLAAWGGKLVEPEYTQLRAVSQKITSTCHSRVVKKQRVEEDNGADQQAAAQQS